MLPMKNTLTSSVVPFKRFCGLMRRFRDDEEGGIIIFTLLLLITMLVVGGMAVDFMRFESRRVQLQSVSDRAVLSASDLSQTIDSKVVVRDFFRSAGFEEYIVGEPIATNMAGTKTVRVDSQIDIDTIYLRLVGIDQLSAPAVSGAVEGTGNVEVSLVLDISGSMGTWVSSAGKRRIDLLEEAATSFVEQVLDPEYEDQISVSLVAYSAHVSAGEEIFRRMNTTPDTMYLKSDGTLMRVDSSEVAVDEITDVMTIDGERQVYTNPAHCIDFPDSHFSETGIRSSHTYQQAEHFQPDGSGTWITSPTCPEEDFQGIVALSQDVDLLTGVIEDYEPTKTTSIHLGMKWGVALLDPSMRDILSAGVSSVDPIWRGIRPADYIAQGAAVQTTKYIVLMTDGVNVSTRRVRPQYYNDFDLMRDWGTYRYGWWQNNMRRSGQPNGISQATYQPHTVSEQDSLLQAACDAAKDENIIVFSIAMGAPSEGQAEMRECASSDAHYFETEGGALVEIFDQIARQITELRLTL